jgi:hypothetical protein
MHKSTGRTINHVLTIERDIVLQPLLKGFLKQVFAGDPQKKVAKLLAN